jgi:hypothetical protein
MSDDKPTAAAIVAQALNLQGIESDDGEPWTEEKVAAIYDRFEPLMRSPEMMQKIQDIIEVKYPAPETGGELTPKETEALVIQMLEERQAKRQALRELQAELDWRTKAKRRDR